MLFIHTSHSVYQFIIARDIENIKKCLGYNCAQNKNTKKYPFIIIRPIPKGETRGNKKAKRSNDGRNAEYCFKQCDKI